MNTYRVTFRDACIRVHIVDVEAASLMDAIQKAIEYHASHYKRIAGYELESAVIFTKGEE